MSIELYGQNRKGFEISQNGEKIVSNALIVPLKDIGLDLKQFSPKLIVYAKSQDLFVRLPAGAMAPCAANRAKRFMDFTLALLGLIFLFPFLAIIALLIVIDSPGNPIFMQARTGFRGRNFKIWKFRTMKVRESGLNVTQAERNDARVTRIGAFLRQTSIDELPQLVNVLLGDMSLVGPRPHAIAHDIHYGALINEYCERFRARPGITGLAQISGARGPTPSVSVMANRVNFDLDYVENWSFWLDIKILFRTITSFVAHDAF